MAHLRQRGVVLIVVLWITVLLTVLLVAFTATIKVDRNVTTDMVQRVQARASAEAVLNYLVAVRQSGEYDWSAMAGQVYKLQLNSMEVRFRFIPEESFVSLNSATVEDLDVLLSTVGVAEAAAVAEHIVQRRVGGVDNQTGEMVAAKPWVSPVELSQLPEISPEVYEKIQGWFTVDSAHQHLDFRFADAELIRALKGPKAEQILAERETQEQGEDLTDFLSFGQGAELMRVQVELSSTVNKRQVEVSVVFAGGEFGYRIARWNEYNARFKLD